MTDGRDLDLRLQILGSEGASSAEGASGMHGGMVGVVAIWSPAGRETTRNVASQRETKPQVRRHIRRIGAGRESAVTQSGVQADSPPLNLLARAAPRAREAEVTRGDIVSSVKVTLAGGDTITAVITSEAIDELGLAPGSDVTVLVKATEVMLATD